jgi:hypothetical protein
MAYRGHLRSVSAGIGRSQKVILRSRIGRRTFTGQGWRPAHRHALRLVAGAHAVKTLSPLPFAPPPARQAGPSVAQSPRPGAQAPVPVQRDADAAVPSPLSDARQSNAAGPCAPPPSHDPHRLCRETLKFRCPPTRANAEAAADSPHGKNAPAHAPPADSGHPGGRAKEKPRARARGGFSNAAPTVGDGAGDAEGPH